MTVQLAGADQGLLDEVAEDEALALVVDDLVAHVDLVVLEDVEDGQQLPVVGHQRLPCRQTAAGKTVNKGSSCQ